MKTKEFYETVKQAMADNDEVVAFCDKQLARYKVDPEVIKLREDVAKYLNDNDGLSFLNKELAAHFEVKSQRMSAALRYLVGEGKVERIEGESKSDPLRFMAA